MTTIETFLNPEPLITHSVHREPYCFNGHANITRYLVTIEQIIDPKRILAARIIKLWTESDNNHDMQPLKEAAAKIGLDLSGHQWASKRPRKKRK